MVRFFSDTKVFWLQDESGSLVLFIENVPSWSVLKQGRVIPGDSQFDGAGPGVVCYSNIDTVINERSFENWILSYLACHDNCHLKLIDNVGDIDLNAWRYDDDNIGCNDDNCQNNIDYNESVVIETMMLAIKMLMLRRTQNGKRIVDRNWESHFHAGATASTPQCHRYYSVVNCHRNF